MECTYHLYITWTPSYTVYLAWKNKYLWSSYFHNTQTCTSRASEQTTWLYDIFCPGCIACCIACMVFVRYQHHCNYHRMLCYSLLSYYIICMIILSFIINLLSNVYCCQWLSVTVSDEVDMIRGDRLTDKRSLVCRVFQEENRQSFEERKCVGCLVVLLEYNTKESSNVRMPGKRRKTKPDSCSEIQQGTGPYYMLPCSVPPPRVYINTHACMHTCVFVPAHI